MSKPTGITARFDGGWCFVTVPAGPAPTQVQAQLNGAWQDAPQHGTEWLVAVYATHTISTPWRARYGTGEWTTGKATYPNTFHIDGAQDPVVPPNPDPGPSPDDDGKPKPPPDRPQLAAPGNPRVTAQRPDQHQVDVAWDPVTGAAGYEVQLHPGMTRPRRVNGTTFTFPDLQPGTYHWTVRAVDAGGHHGAEATGEFQFGEHQPDPDPGPTPDPGGQRPEAPRNVRAHCVTFETTRIEWDRDPTVMEYEVWLDGQEDHAQHTQDTIVYVTGLQQNTPYVAKVRAHNAHGASEPGQVRFVTGVPEPAPDEDPDTETGADYPAPDLTVWPLEGGRVRATWKDPDNDGTGKPRPKGEEGYQ